MGVGLGSLVANVCDKFLPRDLQFLGHIAGGVLDCYTGNYAAVVQDGIEVLKDFPLDKILGKGGSNPPSPDTIQPPSPDVGKKTTKPDGQDEKVDKAKEFFKQSDADFLKSIENGKLPKEVSESPEGMLQIQARLNRISEMNALMSNMMRAAHDMRMAVIQNLRV